MTSYLLQDHEFRSTPAALWTRNTVEGKKQAALVNEPGTEYLHCSANIFTEVDISPVEEKFRTILGERRMNCSKSFIKICFKCSDPTIVTNSIGFEAAVPSATITVLVYGSAVQMLLMRNKWLRLKLEVVLEIPDVEPVPITIITNEMSLQEKLVLGHNLHYFVETVAINQPTVFSQHQNKEWKGKVTATLIPGAGGNGGGLLADLARSCNLFNKTFLDEGLYSDFTIISQNGVKHSVHKRCLADLSPVFKAILAMDETKETEEMLTNSEAGIRAFLKFLYYADIDDPLGNVDVALELLELGHKYEIASLQNVIKSMFLSVECISVDLAVTLFARAAKMGGFDDLKKKAVQSLKMRKGELKDSQVLAALFRDELAIAKELFLVCL